MRVRVTIQPCTIEARRMFAIKQPLVVVLCACLSACGGESGGGLGGAGGSVGAGGVGVAGGVDGSAGASGAPDGGEPLLGSTQIGIGRKHDATQVQHFGGAGDDE